MRSVTASLRSMSAKIAHRSSFLQGTHNLLCSSIPRVAALSVKKLPRSARALTTMAASSYKYVVLGGGNSSGCGSWDVYDKL